MKLLTEDEIKKEVKTEPITPDEKRIEKKLPISQNKDSSIRTIVHSPVKVNVDYGQVKMQSMKTKAQLKQMPETTESPPQNDDNVATQLSNYRTNAETQTITQGKNQVQIPEVNETIVSSDNLPKEVEKETEKEEEEEEQEQVKEKENEMEKQEVEKKLESSENDDKISNVIQDTEMNKVEKTSETKISSPVEAKISEEPLKTCKKSQISSKVSLIFFLLK